MSKFPLKETTVAVRDANITVREIKQSERILWVKAIESDKLRGPSVLVACGCVEPQFSEDEVGELPADVVTILVAKIMELSGMLAKGKEKPEKELDAGGAVPLPASSGDGSPAK